MNLQESITQLTSEWYNLISPEHHKDRDCHWKITTLWSYGHPPVYLVEHFGYICSTATIRCASDEEALQALKRELQTAIAKEKEFKEIFNDVR